MKGCSLSDKIEQKEPLSLKDFIRVEATKGTPPAETLRRVREMVAKNPSLLEGDDPLVDFPASAKLAPKE
jgi:hypothetical protein